MLNEPNSPAGDSGNNDDVLQPEGVRKDKAMADPTTLSPREIVRRSLEIAASIDIYTNTNIVVEELPCAT